MSGEWLTAEVVYAFLPNFLWKELFMLMVPDRPAPVYNSRSLVCRYFAQRVAPESVSTTNGCYAVTYRPGGYTGSFKGRTVLPVGTATKFVLSYAETPNGTGKSRRVIPFKGYRAMVHRNGEVDYDSGEPCLHLDLWRRPRSGVGGRVFDPDRNPSLLDTALRMDKACKQSIASRRRLPTTPTAPRTLLEFAPSRLPPFQDTPALRALAADLIGVRVHQLGANGNVLLNRLLRDAWEQAIIRPADGNGASMLDARLCPGATGFLRAYEDFSELLGVPTWNPTRDVQLPFHTNPALEVLQEVGLGRTPDFESPIGDEVIAAMLAGMRERLGDLAGGFTDEDLLDAITAYSGPLVAWSKELPRLRAQLPVWAAEACDDEDLRRAALKPAEPLWVRYACCIQVCCNRPVPFESDRSVRSADLVAAG